MTKRGARQMRRIETYDCWPELLSLKDTLSLRELAERFSVTPGAISAAFKRTGTRRQPAPPGPRSRRKDTHEELPPEPGEAPAAGRPGSKDDRILPVVHLLGTLPDADIASQAGVSVRTIASYRARHDIQGYAGSRRRGAAGPGARKSKIDDFASLLGQVPDRVVADQAGVTLNAVRNYRAKLGIHASTRPAPAAVATPEPTMAEPVEVRAPSSAALAAWRVVTEAGGVRQVHAVVAASLSDAAVQVDAAAHGTVLTLEWIGLVL